MNIYISKLGALNERNKHYYTVLVSFDSCRWYFGCQNKTIRAHTIGGLDNENVQYELYSGKVSSTREKHVLFDVQYSTASNGDRI